MTSKMLIIALLVLCQFPVKAQGPLLSLQNPEKLVIHSYMRGFQVIDSTVYPRDMYDTVYVQYVDSFVMYHFPVRVIDLSAEDGGPYKIVFEYFTFIKGQKNGLLFKDTSDFFLPLRKDVDSIINERGHANVIEEKGIKMISSEKGVGHTLTENYLPDVKRSEFTFDTFFLHYDSTLVNSNYTLGATLDSSRKSKLNGFVFSFNAYYSVNQKLSFPPRDISLKFTRLPFTDADAKLANQLIALFQKHQEKLR
ncbi:hypothetical protein [Filimonas lacunae]|nr:hypothetical protein [Filimonas lacunae]